MGILQILALIQFTRGIHARLVQASSPRFYYYYFRFLSVTYVFRMYADWSYSHLSPAIIFISCRLFEYSGRASTEGNMP